MLVYLMNQSQLIRSISAVGMASLLVVGIVGLGLVGWNRIASENAEIRDLRLRLGELGQRIGRAEQVTLKQDPSETAPALFVPRPDAATARTWLQEKITSLSSASVVQVVSTAALPDDETDELMLVGVSAQLRGSNAAVLSLVQQIELATPALILRKLEIQSQGVGATQDLLSANLTVFAGVRPEPKGQ